VVSKTLARLLPPSITGDAKIQAAANAASLELDLNQAFSELIYIWSRLDELTEDQIDHLAWHLHVDGYSYAITREDKLHLVRKFYDFHRYKGTEYGLGLYWRTLIGRELLKAEPAHKSYLGVSLSPAEREAFEAPHPEIRAYPFRSAGVKQSLFCSDCVGDPVENHPVFPAQTDAILRCGHRLELFDPELEQATPLHDLLYERKQVERLAAEIIELRKPGQAVGQFVGLPLAKPLLDHRAGERLFTLKMRRAYGDEIERRIPLSIQPSLQPMSVYYSWSQDKGQSGQGMFLANRWPDEYPDTGGRAFVGASHPHASDASMRLYKRFKLFDPARVSFSRRDTTTFLGAFRLGPLPPHTAEVAVEMAGKLPMGAMSTPGYAGAGHFVISDCAERIAQVRHVGKLAARRSDKILLSITNRRQVRASAGVLAGSVTAGEYRMEVI
jgi:hypothetical protein